MNLDELFNSKDTINKEELEKFIKDNKVVSLLNGDYVDKHKLLKAEQKVKELEEQNSKLEAMNNDHLKSIEDLKKSSISSDDMNKKLEEIHNDYKTKLENMEKETQQIKLNSLISEAISTYKPKDAEVVKKLLDNTVITVKDGKLIGFDEQMKTLMENSSYLFEVVDKSKLSTPNATNINGSLSNSSIPQDPYERIAYMEKLKATDPQQYEAVRQELYK